MRIWLLPVLAVSVLLAGSGFACTELTCTSLWASTLAPTLALAGVSLFMGGLGVVALSSSLGPARSAFRR